MKYLPDPFIIGLLVMILMAWLVPGIGMGDYTPDLGMIIDAGVFLIFFLYGLKLNPEKIRLGMRNWRMHSAIQITTFLLFPLLILPFYPFFRGSSYEIYWLGMFFLASLPSTVSSSVVMVNIAGGNVPGAIFNASISGLIGILLTPLWMGLFISGKGDASDFSNIIIQLMTQIVIPVVLGFVLHRHFERFITRHLWKLAYFDKVIILLIIYESFSKSFLSGIFSEVDPAVFVFLFGAVILLFFIVFYITGSIATLLKFNRADQITMQFAGSKKSLVHGTVFSSILFTGISGAGVLLLPIMMYHAFQLTYISLVARKKQRRNTEFL